ncbi:MAG: N-acetyltransferase [Microbacteriaceae bacterium]
MVIGIRQATAADAAGLAELAAATFPLACPAHTTDAAKAAFIAEVLSMERFADYLRDRRRQLFVAEDGSGDRDSLGDGDSSGDPDSTGALVGFAMVIFGEPADPDAAAAIRLHPTAEISKLYVSPGYHGTGIAGKLMSTSLSAARASHARGAWLGVNNENARASRFYRKHGFEVIGTKHFRVGGRLEDDFVMECVL